ncbi:MAG: zinc-binding dehydrogenase [Pseudomonadales bacterium]
MRLVNLYAPDDFRIDQVPEPVASDNDVIVQVRYCGICGSDVGYVSLGGLAGPSESAMPLGHELSGTIQAVGRNVNQFEVGDKVCVNPMGAGNAIGNGGGEGGFADLLLVRNANAGDSVYKLPEHLDMRDGALVEPLAVGMHAVNQARPQAGEQAVIFGVGAIGLSCIAALRYKGITNILALDYSAERRERALRMGAIDARSPEDLDLMDYLGEHHGKHTLQGWMPAVGTDIFIDAAGANSIVKSVLDVCNQGARLIVAGLHRTPVDIDLMMVLMKELSITGSMAYPTEFPEVLDMLQNSDLDLSAMVSHHFPLDEFDKAFAVARSPEAGAKIIIDIQN